MRGSKHNKINIFCILIRFIIHPRNDIIHIFQYKTNKKLQELINTSKKFKRTYLKYNIKQGRQGAIGKFLLKEIN